MTSLSNFMVEELRMISKQEMQTVMNIMSTQQVEKNWQRCQHPFKYPFQLQFKNLQPDPQPDMPSGFCFSPSQDQEPDEHLNLFQLTWINLRKRNDKNQGNTRKYLVSVARLVNYPHFKVYEKVWKEYQTKSYAVFWIENR